MNRKRTDADGARRLYVLDRHEAHLAAIVNAVKLAVISVDEAQHIVLFNPEAEAVFRCTAAEALGSPLERFIPPAARKAHRKHMADYDGHTEHGPRNMGGDRILTGLRADGEEFPIDATISRTEVAGHQLNTVILRDVTERVRTLDELKRYADIVDSSHDAILSRRLDGSILSWNRAAEQLFGYSRDEMLENSVGVLHSPKVPQHERDLIQRAIAEERIVDLETVRRHKNGSDVHVAITISLLRDGSGSITGSSEIIRDITGRKRMEAELRRALHDQQLAETQVRESRDQLRELSSALQTIREEEKTRIARELHDELGQTLTALKMDTAAIESELDHAQDALRKRTQDMKAMIDATVSSVRRISADLRPVMLDNLGLVPTLEWLAKQFSERTGIAAELDIPEEHLGVSGDAATAIFRIVQEALTNVARHSGASRVTIEVERSGGNIAVRIADNGKGFADGESRKPRSFGLLGMRERAYVLGGELKVVSSRDAGTRIEALIPIFGTGQGGVT